MVFKSEQINKEAYILQLDGGQQAAKRRKRYDEIDSRLYCLGLKYMLLEIDLESICGNFQKN